MWRDITTMDENQLDEIASDHVFWRPVLCTVGGVVGAFACFANPPLGLAILITDFAGYIYSEGRELQIDNRRDELTL
ncbi:MAG: hypothetical protein AB7G06_05775 [Bdellovibrionales bacterium]